MPSRMNGMGFFMVKCFFVNMFAHRGLAGVGNRHDLRLGEDGLAGQPLGISGSLPGLFDCKLAVPGISHDLASSARDRLRHTYVPRACIWENDLICEDRQPRAGHSSTTRTSSSICFLASSSSSAVSKAKAACPIGHFAVRLSLTWSPFFSR